jgi:diguanylate cyclase (GGDEF)-like protein/PAS domain S-box-containing protein
VAGSGFGAAAPYLVELEWYDRQVHHNMPIAHLAALPPERTMQPRVIVIVDDQATNRRLFSKLAASVADDIVVRSFADPMAALEWLAHNQADLLVTDYNMPGMDGAALASRVRSLPMGSNIPIIVITVYDDRNFRLRALEAGATDFLLSPVDHSEFLTRARNLLKLHKQQQMVEDRAQTLESQLRDSELSREEALRDSRERLAQVIDTVPAMIMATDRHGKCIFLNAYQAAFTGLDPANGVGHDVAAMFDKEHAQRSHMLDQRVFAGGQPLPSFEEEILDPAGVGRQFLTTKSPLRGSSGFVDGVLTTSLDITDQKRAQSHLRHLAHYDAQTDLPNRVLLRQRLQQEIDAALVSGGVFALHFLDLDRFKGVNDALGHHLGDRILAAVAKRLQSWAPDGDTVARLGGDEFAVLQRHISGPLDAAAHAQQIIDVVAQPFSIDGHKISMTGSVGISIYGHNSNNIDFLLKNADLAMYCAKAEGRNAYRFFQPSMHLHAHDALMLEESLRDGLANREFVLHYQPQVDLETGKIVGAEALVRWQRPGLGLLHPGGFLRTAEESGLILPIGEWVLREACAQAKSWQLLGLPPLRVAVNISPVQFRGQDVYQMVVDALRDTGLDPWCLELELTESIIMDETEAAAKSLRRLRELGVLFALDDFGTGYSSLSHVKRFTVDRLKIDRTFIGNLMAGTHDAAIVRAIISLGRGLKLKVVAEGVETAQELAYVRAEGCDEIQGMYFSPPLAAEDFVAFLREERSLQLTA